MSLHILQLHYILIVFYLFMSKKQNFWQAITRRLNYFLNIIIWYLDLESLLYMFILIMRLPFHALEIQSQWLVNFTLLSFNLVCNSKIVPYIVCCEFLSQIWSSESATRFFQLTKDKVLLGKIHEVKVPLDLFVIFVFCLVQGVEPFCTFSI